MTNLNISVGAHDIFVGGKTSTFQNELGNFEISSLLLVIFAFVRFLAVTYGPELSKMSGSLFQFLWH